MKVVDTHQAETQLSRLLEQVHAGEEIIIAKNGEPYARLCPLEPCSPRRPGLLRGEIGDAFFAPLPDDELESWER